MSWLDKIKGWVEKNYFVIPFILGVFLALFTGLIMVIFKFFEKFISFLEKVL